MPKIDVRTYPEVFVVGMKIHHTAAKPNEIPKLWETLMQRVGEIEGLDESVHAAYGISIMEADFEETKAFDYIAAMPVMAEPVALPAGMEVYKIPAGEYASVVCPNLASIAQAYDALYTRWLPQSDYQLDFANGNFCFELYGEEYNPAAGSEKFYIYVPVREK